MINPGESWPLLNPMNHDTTYNGTWDSDEDWDGDGFPNLCEVVQGYLDSGNPWQYNIYDGNSKPSTCDSGPINANISWSPTNPQRCEGATLTVNYTPNEGPLMGVSPIHIGVMTNGTSIGTFAMSDNGGTWQHVISYDTNTTSIAFWFQDAGGTVFDNNSGANYSVSVADCIEDVFLLQHGRNQGQRQLPRAPDRTCISGLRSRTRTCISRPGAQMEAVTTTSCTPPTVSENHSPHPGARAVKCGSTKPQEPYLSAESDPTDGFNAINNGGTIGRVAMGANGEALEGEFNLIEVFGDTPDTVYLCAAAFGDNDGDAVASQGPFQYNAAQHNSGDIEITEFLPVSIDSIRDENMDGHFDCGKPVMETEVNGNRRDANYDLRRFFLDELAGDSESITFYFTANTAPGDTVTNVELITSLNRRDFASLDYDLDDVSVGNATHYFRAYPMTDNAGEWSVTVPVEKCGAYRATVRYQVNGNTYYYTDYAQRRDIAIVVSPKKVLARTMYELNTMVVEATDSTFFGRQHV